MANQAYRTWIFGFVERENCNKFLSALMRRSKFQHKIISFFRTQCSHWDEDSILRLICRFSSIFELINILQAIARGMRKTEWPWTNSIPIAVRLAFYFFNLTNCELEKCRIKYLYRMRRNIWRALFKKSFNGMWSQRQNDKTWTHNTDRFNVPNFRNWPIEWFEMFI